MARYRWCSFCTHAFSEEELAEDEYGLPSCPYCGASGMYLRVWNAVRSLYPDLPEEPASGRRYRLIEAPHVAGVGTPPETRTGTDATFVH
ncbi:MAG: hypothetical protein IBX62_02695 [Coriobacteriia bacterium]|nr:hypothetical protein [Coriobacteriia bacterium]